MAGQGEVTSTPAGLSCTSAECTHEFEGEVTLTAAKAAPGYEFAGWIGCDPISATACTVDRMAGTEVTAVFLKSGATGAEGPAGATGPTGRQGPAGPQGPAGQIELVTCKRKNGKQHCTTKLVSGSVSFTTGLSVARATLSRRGVVYATGTAHLARGRISLRLLPLGSLRAGRYRLTLVSGAGSHKRIRTETFTLD